jgi:hypothetical protein
VTSLSSSALVALTPEELAETHETIAAKLREIGARRRADVRTWVSQRESELGNRRHIGVARRLLAQGDPRAAKRGRDYLLAGTAVSEALAALGMPKAKAVQSTAEELRAALGLVAGGKR